MVAKPVKTIELHPLFPLFLTVSNLNSIQPTMTKLCEFSYSTAVLYVRANLVVMSRLFAQSMRIVFL